MNHMQDLPRKGSVWALKSWFMTSHVLYMRDHVRVMYDDHPKSCPPFFSGTWQ